MSGHLLSKADTRRLLAKLQEVYPDAKCQLNYSTPFELLIATMLSAQSTDVRVNMVTERLFKKYHEPRDFAALTPDMLHQEIRELGLWRAKAEHIVACSRMILTDYHGEVPQSQEELVKLPGVGRKTANVVVSNAFGIPALAVDTHVQRVANRLGLANSMNPEITERQLCQRIPRKLWSQAHHLLGQLGRNICTARNPKCDICPVREYCQFCRQLETDAKLRAKVCDDSEAKKPKPKTGAARR